MYSTQKRCAFLSLVKMQALFWHTSLCMLNLCRSKELAFFGAWLRAAHFFYFLTEKINFGGKEYEGYTRNRTICSKVIP